MLRISLTRLSLLLFGWTFFLPPSSPPWLYVCSSLPSFLPVAKMSDREYELRLGDSRIPVTAETGGEGTRGEMVGIIRSINSL